jgi:integrase
MIPGSAWSLFPTRIFSRAQHANDFRRRNVMLSAEALDLLRQWWKARRSRHDEQTPVQKRWLFPGARPGKADDHPPAQPSAANRQSRLT